MGRGPASVSIKVPATKQPLVFPAVVVVVLPAVRDAGGEFDGDGLGVGSVLLPTVRDAGGEFDGEGPGLGSPVTPAVAEPAVAEVFPVVLNVPTVAVALLALAVLLLAVAVPAEFPVVPAVADSALRSASLPA